MNDWIENDDDNVKAVELQTILKENPHLPKSVRDKLKLWIRMYQGDVKASVLLSFESGMITQDQLDEYLEIERAYRDN
jgi:hypothetical protein